MEPEAVGSELPAVMETFVKYLRKALKGPLKKLLFKSKACGGQIEKLV